MHQALKLNNGLSIPQLGLGVYRSEPGAETRDAVISALKLGYRHIDTAQAYQNEADVGQAIRASDVPRQDVWITSKVHVVGAVALYT
jgi:diketogulonate reductase-like aldo/keto reductase